MTRSSYPDIITANENGDARTTPTARTCPWATPRTSSSALDIQDELQTLYTSGTVFHAFLGEKLPDWKAAATLVRKIAENYKLPYYTLSPTYSVCKNHGYLAGRAVYDLPAVRRGRPRCTAASPATTARCRTGTTARRQEFKDRRLYDVATSKLTHVGPLAHQPKVVDVSAGAAVATPTSSTLPAGRYLVATRTCPNCKFACAQMDEAGIPYEELLAEENVELCQRFSIMQAPTMLEVAPDGTVQIIAGAAPVLQHVNDLRAAAVTA